MGNKVNDPGTSQKSHWKIINKVRLTTTSKEQSHSSLKLIYGKL